MNQSDSLEAQLAAAREEVGQLRSELRASERHISRLLEMFEAQKQQLDSHQSTLTRLERVLSDVVTGRVWRTLRAVGNVVKKVVPGEGRLANGTRHGLIARKNTHPMCDEPNPAERRSRFYNLRTRFRIRS